MSDEHFDVIVIGTGPSGGTIASKAAEAGKSVALVDSRTFGGNCALRGCNPKKVYVNAGELADQVRRARGKLIEDGQVRIDWSGLHDFKEEFTRPVAEGKEDAFREKGIKTFHGVAKFVDQKAIEVAGQRLSANRIVIATGARPSDLGIGGESLVTISDDFLQLKQLPHTVVFIGGGYISMEFAGVVAAAGHSVHVIERNEQILSGFDPDLVQQLRKEYESRGVKFYLNATIESISKNDDAADSLRVSMKDESRIDAGLVVHGAGRVPNIGALQLSQGNVAFSENGIAVNEFMRSSSNPAVFATGDCADSGMPRLTPVANEESRAVSKNLFAAEMDYVPRYGDVPKVAFTIPSIASIGLSEQEAREKFSNLEVRSGDMSGWGSVRKTGSTVAGYKLLIDSQTDKIVGAHILGPNAEETINLFALAMRFGHTATDMKSTLFAFPTSAADVRSML
ncbi:dihydrolipoyl dehydrogenase family protein [Rhodopirellula halodulae]|uniref:dihydrolipoyl dehydrogenase family protein n=1 Tax=Rhodopirellula halodulae TaxID=2894198 RepID=UPI001E5577F0|nr:NAD(P)/FAD-dependent oxidoreductase [Rhodopirellula sp. JC737]MCC9658390.1 NAD(P)/FAD-dependent oxidoreductase [Rhodopirellula sp. JC737]